MPPGIGREDVNICAVTRCNACGLARPGVALADIRVPPADTGEGLVAAQARRASHPGAGVLVFSRYVESGYAMRLIEDHPERAGAGYLLKERVFHLATVAGALRRIAGGETVIDPAIVSRLLGRRRRAGPLAELTGRGTRGAGARCRRHAEPGRLPPGCS